MNQNGGGAGDLLPSSRCPKHPSHPPFTGFCSACLLERLSAARLPSPPVAAAGAEIISPEIHHHEQQPTRVRTTLLYLFQLDDDDSSEQAAAQAQGPQLQRKRSLRQSCEWIVCCDTTADSRQSWDGSASASAAAAPNPPTTTTTTTTAAKPIIRPAQMLRRSLSESWRHARARPATASVPINGPGSRSVSSAGMDSEISLGDSIHADTAHNAAARHSSLFKRLYRLGRSRSVHCSSPQITGTLRFHLTPLRSSSSRRGIANKGTQGRRLNFFAGVLVDCEMDNTRH
uniref:DUF740 domain-containing protein n=1 Tax=Leersia perrieri TaxID=77586 RepID=A0A0D9VB09_9ORYZ